MIWPRFGDVSNYVEPFCGSLAVLLARPEEWPPRVETVNDKDCFLANLWRSVQADPDAVAHYADGPVNEADLHARHRWLVETGRERVERLMSDPDYYDAQVAGWWVWGQCLWIGSGWCSSDRRRRNEYPPGQRKRPHLSDGGTGRGVHSTQDRSPRMGYGAEQKRRPQLTGDQGIIARHENGTELDKVVDWRQRPDLTNPAGRGAVMAATVKRKRPGASGNGQSGGVHRAEYHGLAESVARDWGGHRRPNMGGAGGGQGVHAPRLTRQLPQLSGDDGSGAQRGLLSAGVLAHSEGLFGYMRDLAARLRRVRVCCGDWTRVVTPAVTSYIGVTAILLDPPYRQDLRERCYNHDEDISGAVREWAIANGENPKLRIALCGYADEHKMPPTWTVEAWTAGGGYGRTERGKGNRRRERIWFSKYCLRPNDGLPFNFEEIFI